MEGEIYPYGGTALLEKLCAVHLYKEFEAGLYFYGRTIEVDFYIPDEAYAVQAAYSISDENSRKRETDGLKKFHAFQPLKRMLIVTYDEEEVIELEPGDKIEVLPAWKWLLEA